LKQVLTLILALSLYTPHVAKLLAYVDCSYIVLSNQDPLLCDCNKIVDADMIPYGPDNPKQQEISLKADWKYLPETAFRLGVAQSLVELTPSLFKPADIPLQSLQAVFHPPRV